MNELIAVKSGYYFALIPKSCLSHINLEQTNTVVQMPNKADSYQSLYRGATYAEARKIDGVIDGEQYTTYEIDQYRQS